MHGPFDIASYSALVLACDGVWDVVSDNTGMHTGVCARVKLCPPAARLASSSLNDVEAAAMKIRDKAYTRGSKDNISVLVVNLQSTK
jgi:serine/threonine protein phosphatase PrpC